MYEMSIYLDPTRRRLRYYCFLCGRIFPECICRHVQQMDKDFGIDPLWGVRRTGD